MFENFEVPSELIPSDPRFGVGPSLVPYEAIEKLASLGMELIGTSHRRPKIQNLGQEIQAGLRTYFNLPDGYEVLMGNGGATFLFDMIGLGAVGSTCLHYVMGEFSNKWYKAHDNIPWIEAEKVEAEYGQGLAVEYKENFDTICCTLNETSTGVMSSNLPEVPEDVILAVDATSGAGQIKVDFNKVDLYFFSPQKVFASEGGFYIAIISPKFLARVAEVKELNHYRPEVMSWDHAITNSRKGQTYNTPAISTMFLLNEQIRLMNKLGEDKVIAMAQEKLQIMTDWVEAKEYLSFYVADEKYRSQAVATIDIDEKYNATDLTKRLRELNIIVDIEAYRKLGRNQLRISLFHNVKKEDLVKLTKIISLAIEGVK